MEAIFGESATESSNGLAPGTFSYPKGVIEQFVIYHLNFNNFLIKIIISLNIKIFLLSSVMVNKSTLGHHYFKTTR